MPQLQQFTNQRQYQRVKTKNRAFAMLVDWTIKFDIVDISKTGLSFLYLGKDKWFDELAELNIAFGDEFFFKKSPYYLYFRLDIYTLSHTDAASQRHVPSTQTPSTGPVAASPPVLHQGLCLAAPFVVARSITNTIPTKFREHGFFVLPTSYFHKQLI